MKKEIQSTTKTALEIERKFLLKSLPFIEGYYDDVLAIEQYYCSTKKEPNFRIRKTYNCLVSVNPGRENLIYHKVVKKFISNGVYQETEGEIPLVEFKEYLKSAKSSIQKTRYVKNVGELKWEIDVYDFKLVVAEIELPTIDYPLELPIFITDVLIMEVTEFKQFTNKALSNSLKL